MSRLVSTMTPSHAQLRNALSAYLPLAETFSEIGCRSNPSHIARATHNVPQAKTSAEVHASIPSCLDPRTRDDLATRANHRWSRLRISRYVATVAVSAH